MDKNFKIYVESNLEFIANLEARCEEEKMYDDIILNELRKGENIKNALKIAESLCPHEAWHPQDQDDKNQIREHYFYLLEHEKVMKIINKKHNQSVERDG